MTNTAYFKETIWHEGAKLFRDMPWRQRTDAYAILVSELMLQQTQVERVIPKFNAFLDRFPTIIDLAHASLGEVLTMWSGLGYNRRAKYLHLTAQAVVERYDGVLPDKLEDLLTLPGIGPNTAGAILAYSFNQPSVFIETNVRTVYFHHFFADETAVSDKQLKELVAATVDTEHPREWYWAIMDYGAYLKRNGAGRLQQSAHYKKQSPLKGSLREVRGFILKELVDGPQLIDELKSRLPNDDRFERALTDLTSEGMIALDGAIVRLDK